MKKCFTLPLVNLKPSELVEITAKRLPVPNSLEYTGLVKFKIRVDEKSISPMGILKITTIPVPEQELGRYHGYIDGLYQENKQDNRILDDTISEFLPGNTYIVYAYLLDGYVPNKVCFELSVAYSQNEQVCVNIP